MNYSKALAVVRVSRGLQQKDIADILDKSPSYISKIEKGERPMTEEMVKSLCEKLKIPADLFFLIGKDKSNLESQDRELIDNMSQELLKIIVS